MIKSIKLFAAVCLLAMTTGLSGQDTDKPSLDGGSLDSQLEYVIKESNNYQQYKVIQETWMHKLRSHVNDTLQAMRSERDLLKAELDKREQRINALAENLQSTKDTLVETRKAQDEMAFVGVPIEKSSYRITMWTIISVLVLTLLFFVYRFNRSSAVTRQSKEALANIQEDFDQHRKRALEREQKLRRELQDELNKQYRNHK